MKQSLLLSLALLTCASATPARAEINIVIPTAIEAGACITAGVVTGAFSLLAGRFACHTIQENPHNGGRPDKLFYGILTIGSGLAAITSGIISYQSFNNAYKLLK